MKKKSGISLIILLLSINFLSAQALSTYFSKADVFFRKFVSSGAVDYAGIKVAPATLNELVELTANYPVSTASKGQAKAFYINAYNILVIKNVVDHYPISSPMDVAGFFDKKTFKVAGAILTLSDIENKKIRPVYKDARVHFVLVCAGKGCPPLANFAYMPEKLESQLNSQTTRAMNDPSFIKVNMMSMSVQLSQIFEWYKDDFTPEGGFISFINKYRTSKIPGTYKTSFYTYDWVLNAKK